MLTSAAAIPRIRGLGLMAALVAVIALSALPQSSTANAVYPAWNGCTYLAKSSAPTNSMISETFDFNICPFYQVGVRQEFLGAEGLWWDWGWKWGGAFDNYEAWNSPYAQAVVGYHRVFDLSDYSYSPVVTTYQ